ncbi:MAG: glycosyltransferase family 4 protein [bacterium]|nr:glycosyltransferase family 4 protein [bacterium]
MNNKRALIFSTAYFPMVGGAEVAMREVTDRLPDWQFDLICARIQPGLVNKEKIGNVTVHRCGFGKPIDKLLLPFFGVLRAIRVTGSARPVVWSLLASYGGFAALVYTWLRPGSKMLLTLQEGDPLEHYAKRTGKLQWLHKRVFQRADAVQAISRFLGEWAVRMGFRGTPEIIPNGVDIERFTKRISDDDRLRLRTSLGYAADDVVLVTASRLSLKNGVDDLIRSLTLLPSNYKALIIGVGEDEDKLKTLTEQKQLTARVKFLGKKGHDELPGLLQASDIFVRASLSEGLGNAFLEAMAAGLPIIGTPVGGIPDFLKDGETGVFCQPRDPASLAQAVLRIQKDSLLKQALEKNGLAYVQDHNDWKMIALRLERTLLGLCTYD